MTSPDSPSTNCTIGISKTLIYVPLYSCIQLFIGESHYLLKCLIYFIILWNEKHSTAAVCHKYEFRRTIMPSLWLAAAEMVYKCGAIVYRTIVSDLLAQYWSSKQLSKLTSSQSSISLFVLYCYCLLLFFVCHNALWSFEMALYKSLCITISWISETEVWILAWYKTDPFNALTNELVKRDGIRKPLLDCTE